MEPEYDSEAELCVDNLNNSYIKSILYVFVHTIICIVGFVGNTLVILTYAFYKRTKSMTDVYLLNVAIADVLFVVALPLIIYSEQSGWALGPWSCKVLKGVYSINLYSGILLLACISLDRYLAIVQARRSFRLRSSTLIYSYVICAFVWFLSFLLSLPTLIYYERYKPSEHSMSTYFFDHNATDLLGNDTTMFDMSILEGQLDLLDTPSFENTSQSEKFICFFQFTNKETAMYTKVLVPSSQMAVGFFVPLLIMGFCYSSVVHTLLHAKNFQRHKAVRVVLTVVLVFIACHLPYNMALLYDTIHIFDSKTCKEHDQTQLALILTETIAYLHCCLNPLLYAFIGVKFRNHFRKIVEDAWCLGKRYIGARRTSRVTSEMYISTRKSVDSSGCDNGTSFTM